MPKVYTFSLDSNFFRVLTITQETGDTASLRTTETNIYWAQKLKPFFGSGIHQPAK